MEFTFTNQYFELLLLANGLAVILFYAARKKKKQRAMVFGNYKTLEKVAGESFIKGNDVLLILKLAALTSLFLALSDPVLEEEVVAGSGDYVLAIDSSASMLNEDFDPNRLEAAKSGARDFVTTAPNQTSIGVISFSGGVNEEQVLTYDDPAVLDSIENITFGEDAGTATGDAIISASSLLLGSGNESRNVLLVTDGRNNVGSSINESIDFANTHNVTVNTYGIVEESSDPFGSDGEGNINVDNLERIAESTGGNFTAVSDSEDIRESFLEVDKDTVENSVSQYLVLFAVLLMLLEWGLGTTKYDVLP